ASLDGLIHVRRIWSIFYQHDCFIGQWHLKTVPLAYEAIMLVENRPNPSDMYQAIQRSYELKTMLDAGLITPQEHEMKRAEFSSRFRSAEEVNQAEEETL
ncbi:MAG: hypothetical protein R6X32_18630, partial [Chloroflexota bacterium]